MKKISVLKLAMLVMLFLAYTRIGECGPPLLFLGDSSITHTVQRGQPLNLPVFISSGKETGTQVGEVLLGFFVSSEEGENVTGVAYCLDLNNPKGWTRIGDSYESLSDCTPISGVEFPQHLLVNWPALGSVDFPSNSTMTWLACTDPVVDGYVNVAFVEGDDTFCTKYTAKIIPSCDSIELVLDGSSNPRISFDNVDINDSIRSKVMAYEIKGPDELTGNDSSISIVDKPEWLTISLNSEKRFITFFPKKSYLEKTGQLRFQGTVKVKIKNSLCSIEREVPVTISILEQNTNDDREQGQQSSGNDDSLKDTRFDKKAVNFPLANLNSPASSAKVLVYQSKTTPPDDMVYASIEQGQIYKFTLYVKNSNGKLISTLRYSDDSSWMSVRKVSTGQLEVTIDGSSLSNGQSENGKIIITDTSTGAKETVHVSVRVAGVCDPETAMVKKISDKSFRFIDGGSPSRKTVDVEIEDTCGEKLAIEDVELSKNVSWLTIKQNGTTLHLTAEPSGLSAGGSDTVKVTVYTAKGEEDFNVTISVQAGSSTSSTTSGSTGTIKSFSPSFRKLRSGVYIYSERDITLRPGEGILYSFKATVPEPSKSIVVLLQPYSVGIGGSGHANAYIKIGSEPTVEEVKSKSPTLTSAPKGGTSAELVQYKKVMDESQVYVLVYNPGTKSDTFSVSISHY